MNLQRYDFDELTKHECADGEWVKASEAEARIAELEALIKKLKGCENCKHLNDDTNRCKKQKNALECVTNGYKYWECWR